MTKIIIDTNIIFSALLNINSRIGQIIINGNKLYDFYSPEYVRFETFKYKEKIKTIGQLSEDEFIETFGLILRNITILNHSLIPAKTYKNAEMLCKNIDIDDTIFVALSDYLQGILWTGDLKLINGLTKKGFVGLITTDNLYQDFLKKDKVR